MLVLQRSAELSPCKPPLNIERYGQDRQEKNLPQLVALLGPVIFISTFSQVRHWVHLLHTSNCTDR
jgi:hypothetical protein